MEYLEQLLRQELERGMALLQEYEKEIAQTPKGKILLRERNGKKQFYFQYRVTVGEKRKTRLRSLRNESSEEIGRLFYHQKIYKELPRKRHNLKLIAKTLNQWKRPSCDKTMDQEMVNRLLGNRGADVLNEGSPWKRGGRYYGQEYFVKQWFQQSVTVWEDGRETKDFFLRTQEPLWHPEGLKHVTQDGSRRRSKSEVVLDGILRELNVAYVYERPLYLKGRRYLPDYTILRPRDLQPIFLEHYGFTAQTEQGNEYEERNEQKRRAYQSAGIVPWSNLLYTYDLPDGSIDVTGIRKALKLFLDL